MFHWTTGAWLCGQELRMHEFTIVVDSEFLEMARSVEFDPETAQEHARKLAGLAGYRVSKGQQLLLFGEYGIEQINLPGGGGAYLYLSLVSISATKGALYETHNIDHANQQSFLMAVWVWWAGCVTSSM